MDFLFVTLPLLFVVALTLKQSKRIKCMNQAFERLTTEVAELRGVNESAVALITGLAAQIRDAAGNEEALNALADSLDAETNRLADAVAANTPQAPAPEPEPEQA